MGKKRSLRIRFLGAMGCVTGSATLLEFNTGDHTLRYLVDLGVFQNDPILTSDEEIIKLSPTLQGIFLTHAHADHIGRIPLALSSGFKGKIYLTKATASISEVMLRDQMKNQGLNTPDIENVIKEFNQKQYIIDRDGGLFNKRYDPLYEDFQFSTLRSSHILGSCSFLFRWVEDENPAIFANEDKTWMYLYCTGDLGPTSKGSSPGCLFKNVQFPFSDGVDKFIVMESTYGGRKRENEYSKHENRLKKLAEIVNEAIDSESMLVIPTFSLDRAQQIQVDLNYLLKTHQIRDIEPFRNSFRLLRDRTIEQDTLKFLTEIAKQKKIELAAVGEWLSSGNDFIEKDVFQKNFDDSISVNTGKKQKSGKKSISASKVYIDYKLAKEKWSEFNIIWDKHMSQRFSLSKIGCKYSELSEALQTDLLELDKKYPMDERRKPETIQIYIHSTLMGKINQIYRIQCADTYCQDGKIERKYLSKAFLELFGLDPQLEVEKQTISTLKEFMFDYEGKNTNAPFSEHKNGKPSIILTSSGMVDKGMILGELENILLNENAIILLTGYQSINTNGYLLQQLKEFDESKKYNTKITIPNGTDVRLSDIKCRIMDIGAYYSGHADHNQLVEYATWPKNENNRTVFLLHGSDEARKALKESIEGCQTSKNEVIMPSDTRQWYTLSKGGIVELDTLEEEPIPIEGEILTSINGKGITVKKVDSGLQINLSINIERNSIVEILSLITELANKNGAK
jgi:Cft2 family RNA processing exonuclease